MTQHAPPKWRLRVCTSWLLALLLALVTPSPARAHTRLVRSTPAAGSRLASAPRLLRLEFNERPSLAMSSVRLLDATGAGVALGALAQPETGKGGALAAEVARELAPGTYTVQWRVASDDGHPVHGRFGFTVLPASVASPATGAASAPATRPASPASPAHDARDAHDAEFDAGSPAYVILRWVHFCALFLLLGVVAFRQLVMRPLAWHGEDCIALCDDIGWSVARLAWLATLLLLLTLPFRLYAQAYALHGGSASFVFGMLARTLWGWGFAMELGGALLVLAGLARLRPRRATRSTWTLATVGAVAIAFTPALSGHAASVARLRGVSIAADGLHVLGAAGWLGSLVVLLLVGIPAAIRRGEEGNPTLVAMVSRFSLSALACATAASVTGLAAAWMHLGGWSPLFTSPYGHALLRKLVVLAVVVAGGANNWLRLRPLIHTMGGAERLRRTARVEVAAAVVVLLLTAILVATPTPADASGP